MRSDLLSLGRALMMSQDPSLAAGAQQLVGEAEEAIRSRQQRVRVAFRALGAASDISEIGSIDLSGPRDHLAPSRMPLRQEGLPAGPAIERQPQVVLLYFMYTLECATAYYGNSCKLVVVLLYIRIHLGALLLYSMNITWRSVAVYYVHTWALCCCIVCIYLGAVLLNIMYIPERCAAV
jgi:hypothetical protein